MAQTVSLISVISFFRRSTITFKVFFFIKCAREYKRDALVFSTSISSLKDTH